MRLYVLRHGETPWNKRHLLQGQTGADLDEEGVLLAEITAKAMRDIPIDLCVTSPLVRARHTAQILLEGRDVPIIEDDRLMEISLGEWEGKSFDLEKHQISAENYIAFRQDPFAYIPPKGGETIREVIDRTGSLYRELIRDDALQDKTILISTHGCASRAFLNPLFDDPRDFWQGSVPLNCSVSIVDIKDGVGKITLQDHVYYGKEYYHNHFQLKQRADGS